MVVGGSIHQGESLATGFKFVRSTSSLGRKRVALSNSYSPLDADTASSSPKKRLNRIPTVDKPNHLEALPQDILVKVLCKADHDDLKQLLRVSRAVNAAALIARELHFAFSTPSSKSMLKREETNGGGGGSGSEEAPNAPRQQRFAKSRLSGVRLSSIAVALFRSPDDGSVLRM